MMPDDLQKYVNLLQSSLVSRNIRIPQPKASCDAVLCFCGIRLHQIGSLSCPASPSTNHKPNTNRRQFHQRRGPERERVLERETLERESIEFWQEQRRLSICCVVF
ncbi:hypothetical protein C1H46_021711 [Malus baccata]|uniref:Uncharacterized protein n=1 Tax=Malus baccata TaxID=106549 RepID=A0A540M1Y7_MALBA|nr:hypothetical protein C1H46_021711 [Malus baccata]